MNKELLLFYMCNQTYDYFIPLFCYFANLSNPGATIEIHTPEYQKFKPLTEMFNLHLHILDGDISNVNMRRFLDEPVCKLPYTYTYIGDIDILLLQNVLDTHKHMVDDQVPVCNIIRDPEALHPRITGLQFVKSDPYFKDTRKLRAELREEFYPLYNDEHVLYKLISGVYGDILTIKNTERLRPVLGVHCSPNRHPEGRDGQPGWGLEKGRREKAVEILSRPEFGLIESYLQPQAWKIVNYLKYPEQGWDK